MGHYASEMRGDRTAEQEVEHKERERRAAYVKADIEKRGVEHVLVDILTDPILYRIRSRL